jgi:hypothetical protein
VPRNRTCREVAGFVSRLRLFSGHHFAIEVMTASRSPAISRSMHLCDRKFDSAVDAAGGRRKLAS